MEALAAAAVVMAVVEATAEVVVVATAVATVEVVAVAPVRALTRRHLVLRRQ